MEDLENLENENEIKKEILYGRNKNKKSLIILLIAIVLGFGVGFGISKMSSANNNISQKDIINLIAKKREKQQQGDKYFIFKLRNAKMNDVIKVGKTEYKVTDIEESEASKKIDFVDVNDETNKLYVIRELETAEISLTSISFIKSKSLEEKDYGTYFDFDTVNTDENEISIITIKEGTIEKNELSSKTLKIELTKENLEKISEMLSVGDFNLDNYRKLVKK